MIIVNLKGGLGNQMFQYATGLALADKNETQLLLDTSSYSSSQNTNNETPRNFDLDRFKITAHDATAEQMETIKYPYGSLSRILRDISKKVFKQYYEDYHPDFLDRVSQKLSRGKDFYLDGYFQSEKNFSGIRDQLLKEFSLKDKFVDDRVKDFLKQIETTNSIAIHIRRGDYANDPKTTNYHGLLPILYYREAMELMMETVEHPHFYIFTDDTEWVKENLKISGSNTYVAGTGLSYHQEFYLMTKCKHHIIANSSFSWWGAWLSQNPSKNVIAPKKWTVKNTEHPNIIPEGWIEV